MNHNRHHRNRDRNQVINCPLAVFAPDIGTRSETFIRRHVRDLLPGRTAAVGRVIRKHDLGDWAVNGPVLDLGSIQHRVVRRALRTLTSGLRLRSVLNLDPIRHFLRKHKVRVIMGEYLDESLPWLEVAQELGIRFFGHAHGYDVSEQLRKPKWQAEYLRYNQAAGVITMNQVSRARLIDLGLEPNKVHVVPYGVDVPDRPLQRPERGIVACVAVGRMVAKKAPILTLDAFRQAAEACPELRLDYIGAGDLLPAARQFIHDFSLEDKVWLHGSQPNHVVQRLMKNADIFLQHSMTDPDTGDEEGLPVAILEAMAHALPVVSTWHAGIPEAVGDGSTGFLVDECDSETMAEQIKFLARRPGMRRKLGQAGWARAREYFSWEKERAALLEIMGIEG